jgi:membrane dipeptidase
LVEKFYNLGARYIGLSHTGNNQVADSSTDNSGPLHDGLSEFGKEVVKRMNQLGMMIDVSHISYKAVLDVLEITTLPIIASHSNAKAICDHPRNLSDDLLVAIAKNGGVVQVCVLSAYVKKLPANPEREQAMTELRVRHNNFQDLTDEQMEVARADWFDTDRKFPAPMATVADLVDHIDHIVKVAGIDYVGIGTDFDGGGALKDCYDVSELKNITRELIKRGYSFEDIEKIWGGNFMRVFEANHRAAK